MIFNFKITKCGLVRIVRILEKVNNQLGLQSYNHLFHNNTNV